MHLPNKNLLIKIAIAIAIVSTVLVVIREFYGRKSLPTLSPSLIPAKEGIRGDGLPEYTDVERSP
jgi:hypothetical protein